MDISIENQPPRADLAEIEAFERKRYSYFADEYSKTSLYWSSLCDLMGDNDGSTQQVLTYMAGKLEADRVYTAYVYANADKVFGDKKGAAKLRHDKIRHAELKAKQKGTRPSVDGNSMKPGGEGKELPASTTVRAIWEMAEMDCRAARLRDILCDELEQDNLLGKVKAMSKETHRRFKELSEEGDACLLSLRNIDKRVGQSFLHLKETLGYQLGGKALTEDVWFLDCRYRTAVVHQKEAWAAVTNKLREVFNKMRHLEAHRRDVLKYFMVGANLVIGDTWTELKTLCGPACDSANAIDGDQAAVDRDVAVKATSGVEEKKRTSKQAHQLANITGAVSDPPPGDDTFIDTLSAPLESPLIRAMMMVERREGKAIGSKYHPGLMALTWDGFVHFFDVPESSSLKSDASPAAAFQDISPSISLDDLVANKKDLEEVLLFKSTATLQLVEDSVVEAASSKKSHKIEVTGTRQKSAFKRHFGSGTEKKTITFRTATEAAMNHAVSNIKDCIQAQGGMTDMSEQGYPLQGDGKSSGRLSGGGRSSFGSVKSDPGYPKQPTSEPEGEFTPPPSFMNSNASTGSQPYSSNASSAAIATAGRDSTGGVHVESPSSSSAAPEAPEEQAPVPAVAAPVATVVEETPVAKPV